MTESHKRQQTKKKIENAMVELLQSKSFDHITTIDLAEKAGISRSSFYTHYKDKYEMIDLYQAKLFHTLEYIFDQCQGDKRESIIQVFQFLQREPLFAALLSENGTREIQNFLRNKFYIIYNQDWQHRFSTLPFSPIEKEYSNIFITNALFGVFQMWISRGKKESPQEMTDFLLKMLRHETGSINQEKL